jgi:replicative DNA helicase
MGKTSLATNIAFNIAHAYEPAQQADGSFKAANGGVIGFFSLEMSPSSSPPVSSPSRRRSAFVKIRRGEHQRAASFEKLVDAARRPCRRIPLYHRPDRRHLDRPARGARAAPEAPARLDVHRHRLSPAADRLELQARQREPRAGNHRDHDRPEGAGEGARCRSSRCRSSRARSKAATTSARSSPDLRESGSIEQDADVVLFVYREEYYLKNKEPKPGTDEYLKWEGEMNDARGKAEVIIAKQRHGPTGTVAMGFQGEFTRFFDLAEDSHLPERFE